MYIPKVGDIVQVWIYDEIEAIGTVVTVENYEDDFNCIIKVKDENGDIWEPWNKWCIRKLTKLEIALL